MPYKSCGKCGKSTGPRTLKCLSCGTPFLSGTKIPKQTPSSTRQAAESIKRSYQQKLRTYPAAPINPSKEKLGDFIISIVEPDLKRLSKRIGELEEIIKDLRAEIRRKNEDDDFFHFKENKIRQENEALLNGRYNLTGPELLTKSKD